MAITVEESIRWGCSAVSEVLLIVITWEGCWHGSWQGPEDGAGDSTSGSSGSRKRASGTDLGCGDFKITPSDTPPNPFK